MTERRRKVGKADAEIGRRIAAIRKANGISRRLAAEQTGVSQDQIDRIERGEARIRFFAAWNFCQFTDTNPLWLAFGGYESKTPFESCVNSMVPDTQFLAVMERFGDRYREYRGYSEEKRIWEVGWVFNDPERLASLKFDRRGIAQSKPEKKTVGVLRIKQDYTSPMAITPKNWEECRHLLRLTTETRPRKERLADELGVSLAAISQWRTDEARPTADNTLRILDWVRRNPAAQPTKKRAETAATAPALTTRKGKIKTDEKPKSDRKKR